MEGEKKKQVIKIDGGQVQLGGNTPQAAVSSDSDANFFFLFEVSSLLLITVISMTKSSHL